MNCRSCNHKIDKFFSLGKMPLANSFLKKNELNREKKYDLSVGFCPNCYLVQLIDTVSPEELFRHYLYFSSTSQTYLKHCYETATYLTDRLKLNNKSLVLEIASNDGSQLQLFKDRGCQILGVDPARNIAKVANQKGIPTLAEFFNYKFAKHLLENKGIKADLVYGANILAHVPGIVDFLKGIKIVLKNKGTAIFEFPYLIGLFQNKFDTIYHEHVFYYGMLSLRNLFQKVNLEIYDVETLPIQGGSLRIFVSHPQSYPHSKKVSLFINNEIKDGLNNLTTYTEMKNRIQMLKNELLTLLKEIKNKRKKIAAYSAPAKGNILLNYFGIGENFLDFIVDRAKEKQGLFTPGTHLKVYPPEKIYSESPDYLLILCWNIAEEVIKQLKNYRNLGGKFIIPVPEIKIL